MKPPPEIARALILGAICLAALVAMCLVPEVRTAVVRVVEVAAPVLDAPPAPPPAPDGGR